MKLQFLTLLSVIGPAFAAYSGDIVAYWNKRTSDVLIASSPRISSLREAYYGAIVHTAILKAADDTEGKSRALRQTAISHAAHNVLVRHFGNQYRAIGGYFREIEGDIGASANEKRQGKEVGERAASKVIAARAGDKFDEYIRYEFKPPAPGVYQPTPPSNNLPADPHGAHIRPFGGIKRLAIAPPPPNPKGRSYFTYLKQVKEKGARTGSTRTPEETEIGLYWVESSITYWNRFARAVVGNKLDGKISEAARFYAKLSWAIANAGIIGFDAKNRYDAWRPITALHYTEPYLYGGRIYNDPSWQPLVDTPSHQDYLSGHAVYGSGAGGILRRYLGTDSLNPPVSVSSNVTHPELTGEITRTYDSVDKAVVENGVSRVYIGVHFLFASDEGNKVGYKAADDVWNYKGKDYL